MRELRKIKTRLLHNFSIVFTLFALNFILIACQSNELPWTYEGNIEEIKFKVLSIHDELQPFFYHTVDICIIDPNMDPHECTDPTHHVNHTELNDIGIYEGALVKATISARARVPIAPLKVIYWELYQPAEDE